MNKERDYEKGFEKSEEIELRGKQFGEFCLKVTRTNERTKEELSEAFRSTTTEGGAKQ